MTELNEVIEFELSKELKEKFRGIFYHPDSNVLNFIIKPEKAKSKSKPRPIKWNVDKSSMRNTLEQFNKIVDGTLDPKTKLLCVYSIKFHLRDKYVKFDIGEQIWYSENYPDDPSLSLSPIVDKSKSKSKVKKQTKKIRSRSGTRTRSRTSYSKDGIYG